MTPVCNRKECFANLKGHCQALTLVESDCSFFKTASEVDRGTMKILRPREKKPSASVNTASMSDKAFEDWFTKEWNETTLSLLVNHGDEIAKIKIVMEA